MQSASLPEVPAMPGIAVFISEAALSEPGSWATGRVLRMPRHSMLWEPSQKGSSSVALQPQTLTVPVLSAT